MPSIPDNFVDDLLVRVDLHDLLGRYITLKKVGSRFMGVCPFHGDSNPSLSVTPDKGFWYCFGCQTGGDAITFVRKQENLDFVEAVRFLARLYGIPIPEGISDPHAARRRTLIDINDSARDFFVKVLKSKHGRPFVAYLSNRGFEKDTVLKYRLGASLPGWDHLAKYLVKQGHKEQDLVDAGVALARKGGGGVYDRFRGRLMIPIVDTLERTLGFGARAMGDDEPKYINSPESPAFQKSKILFGLDLAKGECRKSGQLIIMEGYTDVMQAHQAGVENSCAVMGTALTSDHLPLIARFAGEIVLAFDADEAGMRATTRSLMTLAGADFAVKVLPMPEGSDPADIIRNEGASSFRERVAASLDGSTWLFRTYGEPARDKSISDRLHAFESVAPYIAAFSHHPSIDELRERAAIAFNLNISALMTVEKQVGTGTPGPRFERRAAELEAQVRGGELVERILFLRLLDHPQFLPEIRDSLYVEDFDNPLHRRLARVFFQDGFALGTPDGLLRLPEINEDEDLYAYVVGLTMEHDEDELQEDNPAHSENELRSSMLFVVRRQYERKKKVLQGSMSEVQAGKMEGWQKVLLQLQQELQDLDDDFRALCFHLGGEKISREEELCN